MSLFIQNDSGLVGAGTVSALDAIADLLVAANFDGQLGQAAVAGNPALEQITYPSQDQTGPPPDRIFQLVNTDFGLNPDNIDIVVIAADAGFSLNDGSLVSNIAGTSLDAGATFDGIVFNPTASVVVVYDISVNNSGSGFCVQGQASGSLDAPFPNPVILFHELSHSLRQATNSLLDTTEVRCTNASDEETAAEVDENLLRTQMGVPLRDPNNHCGTPGCSGGSVCCVVASVATGSPYSVEVRSLRLVRDRFLRASAVGADFFDRLHFDYYSFSPQVCRLMAQSQEARRQVEGLFVRPLVVALEIMHDYSVREIAPETLGSVLLDKLEAAGQLAALTREELDRALGLIRGVEGPEIPDALGELIRKKARSSAYVDWALIQPLEALALALRDRLDGLPAARIGAGFAERLDDWAVQMPLAPVWRDLSDAELRAELDFLQRALLKTPEARCAFGQRLRDHLGGAFDVVLAQAGYLAEEGNDG